MSDYTLAIDFGTSNSLVGAFKSGLGRECRIEALPIDPCAKDPSMMRTLLYFPNQDSCFFGAEALQKFIENDMEGRLFRSFKSLLPNQNYLSTMIDRRVLTIEEMIGMFLSELKRRAEQSLGASISRAVIGRPARFSMDDISEALALQRMQRAASFAGFDEVQFIPEPLAAALEYRRHLNDEKIVLVGDFGGGTSDFTILRITQKPFEKKDVLSIDGCPLSGDALDSLFMSNRLNRFFGGQVKYRMPMSKNLLTMPSPIMESLNKPAHIVQLKERRVYQFIKEVQNCAMSEQDKKWIQRLFILMEDQQIFPFFEEIEDTKINLSLKNSHNFNFDYPGIETHELFYRNEFELWSKSIKMNIFEALERCIEHANIEISDIDHIFLTGGTAHVPFIREEFERIFGSSKLNTGDFFHSVLSGLIEIAKLWSQSGKIL